MNEYVDENCWYLIKQKEESKSITRKGRSDLILIKIDDEK